MYDKSFEKVYDFVKRIPAGKVVTYGEIAKKLKAQSTKVSPRLVGEALHNNPDPQNIPCHRVVDRNGKVAENYAFGGWMKQRRKLLTEGVKFRDKMHVDLLFL